MSLAHASGGAPAPGASGGDVEPSPSLAARPGLDPDHERYLSPDGSNRAHGTVDAPWRTLAFAASRLRAGDTLWIRGGTYQDVDVSWTVKGTAAAPIVVRAYPGEQPVFDGNGTEDRFLWLHVDAAWLILRDLHITGYGARQTGVIVLSDGAHDVTLHGLDIQGMASGTEQDHLVYLSAPGVHDVTIEGSRLAGASGAAIHVYHDPAARGIRILENTIEGGRWGVILYSGTSDVLVRGNEFVGVPIAVKLERATGVRLIGNRATGRQGIVLVGPPVQAEFVDEGNTWPAPVHLQAP